MAGDEKWLSAADAVELLKGQFESIDAARQTIIEWCAADLVTARCKRHQVDGPRGIQSTDDCQVPTAVWVQFRDPHYRQLETWAVGNFTASFQSGGGYNLQFIYHRVFGVQFAESELRANAGIASTTPSQIAHANEGSAPSSRGAPRKTFWEDLWAEIAAQIATGELSASKAAAVERAMLTWAEQNNENLSESTAKLRAAKLIALIRGKADKSKI